MGEIIYHNGHYRMLLKIVSLLAVCKICHCSSPRPHIIFIVADDLGWNDVSFHGSKQIPTPNIDSLASDGIVLHNYYVSPICTPSRGSLMTAKYPIRLGLQHDVIYAAQPWGLPLEEKILPQYMKDLGYRTHGIGKWHLGNFKKEYLPTSRGFDSFFGYWNGKKDYYNHFTEAGLMHGLDLHDDLVNSWNYTGVYATDVFTEKAKEIIRNHDHSKPLFLYLSHQAVHGANSYATLQAPPEYVKKFPHIKDHARKIFAGMVSALDFSVGEIFKTISEAGILNNTILVFTTDNGAAVEGIDGSTGSNWPLRGSKYNMWEGGVRGVSFVWSSELRHLRHVSKEMMHVSDWLPTLVTASGGNASALGDIDGFNQWDCIRLNITCLRTDILHNIDPIWEVQGIRRNDLKLLKGSVFGSLFNGWFDKSGKRTSGGSKYSEMDSIGYFKHLKTSSAAQVLHAKYNLSFPSLYLRVVDLANITDVNCGVKPKNASKNCDPNQSPCLFNIAEDPCEYYNLAGNQPQEVQELEDLLTKYQSEMVPVANQPNDEASNPKYHGYAWIPWKSLPLRKVPPIKVEGKTV